MTIKIQKTNNNLQSDIKDESDLQVLGATENAACSKNEQERICQSTTYTQPPLDLLNEPIVMEDTEADYRSRVVEAITNKLAVFGIRVEIADISVGTTVTAFVFNVLSQHTRMSEFAKFSEDIKVCAETSEELRIVAPVHGKRQVCIEVANRVKHPVLLRGILESENFQKSKGNLVFAIGQRMDGEAVVADLADMPHMLIAGSTGSGKSMALNCLIVSLMYKYSPEYVRFVMIDPKFVELSRYNGIPHMLTDETVTTNGDALAAMDYLINEMESRYELFYKKGVRNICEYNGSVNSGTARLPYLVFVVDELSDLMAFNKQSFETKLLRIAQKSRAAGIHIVLATQRPDVKVITGTIKANLPCRMAFKVASFFDSNTIINYGGAENLLGKGDMLVMLPDSVDLLRVQGAFVSNDEIRGLVDYMRTNNKAHFDEKIAEDIFVSQRQAGESSAVSAEKYEQYIKFKLTADGKGYRASSRSERTPADVVIPSRYHRLPVTKVGEGAFFGCNELVSVTLPKSVKSIGEEAFAGCGNLTTVTIPSSVKCICDLAFFGCVRLKEVYYSGTQEQWQEIQIGSGNDSLTDATIHFKK